MNRILLESDEVDSSGRIVLCGQRARHINKVLHAKCGDILRIGLLDGPRGEGRVIAIEPDCVEIYGDFEGELPPAPQISLLLALPRPKVMRRLWAPLASLGVRRIILTNAEKVERNYFATHWLEEMVYRPLLIEGLQQSGDTRLPEVTIIKKFKPFIQDQICAEFEGVRKLLLHPRQAQPLGDIKLKSDREVLLAIGPEGGWSDYEVDLLAQYGFECVMHGWRVLRTDVACIAAIAAVNLLQDRKQ